MCGDRRVADNCVERALKSVVEDVRGLTVQDLEIWAFSRTRREVWNQASDSPDVRAGNEDTIPSLLSDEAFGSLEADQKEALLLIVTEGLSIAQTADILELAPERVNERVMSARTAYQSHRDGIVPMANQDMPSGLRTVRPLHRASA